MKTINYKYPFVYALDMIKGQIRTCSVLFISQRPGNGLTVKDDLRIQYLRTVNDIKIAGYIDESIGNDWFI